MAWQENPWQRGTLTTSRRYLCFVITLNMRFSVLTTVFSGERVEAKLYFADRSYRFTP